jgi:hypothetical protein
MDHKDKGKIQMDLTLTIPDVPSQAGAGKKFERVGEPGK